MLQVYLADIVVQFLEQGLPNGQLQLILDGTFREEGDKIDKLYQHSLSFQNSSVQVLDTFKKAIGVIVPAMVPLHRSDLYHFLQQLEDGSSIDSILAKLPSAISLWNRIHISHLLCATLSGATKHFPSIATLTTSADMLSSHKCWFTIQHLPNRNFMPPKRYLNLASRIKEASS